MTAPRTVNLYAGEGRIIMLPKFKFGFNWWAGDPFIECCNDTILRVLENLIINQVLICHTEIKPVSFLYFFKRTTVTDYFSTNCSLNINLGSIEEKVLKIVSKRRSISAKKMIDLLISDILETPERITNPWREIFRKVIEKNILKAWAFNYSKNLLGKKIEVIMNDSFEKNLAKIINEIEEQCAYERIHNNEFAEVSRRIYEIIEREMRAHHDKPSGGS